MPTRDQIVAEARRWIGTPYHLGAELRGIGCDCATLILGVWRACGIVTDEHLGLYSHDWFHHTSDQRYMLGIMRHATKVAESVCHRAVKAEPGCVVLTKCVGSERFNHGGIVTVWPKVIHAVAEGVEEIDAARHPMWERHQLAIFDPVTKDIA